MSGRLKKSSAYLKVLKAKDRVSAKRTLAPTLVFVIMVLVGCSPSAPSPSVDLTGTWVGTASDAGPVRWTIAQTMSTWTGTMTLLDASTSATVVSGQINGTTTASDAGQTLTFEQTIAFFQFPLVGPWSQYYAMGFDTTGALTLRGSNQLVGGYLGSANMLRSPPSPMGAGGPFTNGTLTLTKQ